jgi:predicted Zn-dependent peptidase
VPQKGTLETVPPITRDDLESYRRKSFARAGLKIAVVGDIDEKTLVEALDRAFADLASRAGLTRVEDRVMRGGEERKIDLPVPQSVIVFGLPGLARKDKDYVPAVVMNHILGGGSFTSRLWTEVREKRGLAYSVYSSLSPFKHGPILAGATSTKNERARESISVITAEIEGLSGGDVSADELDKAKKYLTGSFALRFDISAWITSAAAMKRSPPSMQPTSPGWPNGSSTRSACWWSSSASPSAEVEHAASAIASRRRLPGLPASAGAMTDLDRRISSPPAASRAIAVFRHHADSPP